MTGYRSSNVAEDDAGKGQLILHHTTRSSIRNCVFLRSQFCYGVAIKLESTSDTLIEQNVFGLDLNFENAWLATALSNWTNVVEKLSSLKSKFCLSCDQGYYKSCLYTGRDRNITVCKNIFNGSMNPKEQRDHVIYLKGFHTARVIMNYARGWPCNPSGGIKARNGQNLEIVYNFIVDTGVLLYTHDPGVSGHYYGLKNVRVHGNEFIVQSNVGHRTSGISYYSPHRTGLEQDENIVYSSNVFLVPNPKDRPMCINTTNGNPAEHHIHSDNVYCVSGSVPYETVNTSIPVTASGANITNYSGYSVPRWDIPPYK